MCGGTNCINCLNETTCYDCNEEYYLEKNGICMKFNCNDNNCVDCPVENVCMKCKAGYYLYEDKCYFGSSLLCENGYKGASYGKCD